MKEDRVIDSAAQTGGAVQVPGSGDASVPEFETLLVAYQSRLESALDEYLAKQAESAEVIGASTREISDPLRQFVGRGGKRIRPALVHFAYRAAGGEDERSLPLEMAVELLHTYLLIHDDIMDRAEMRRGEPAAHRLYADFHRANGWAGDSGRHGEAVAILLGDLAHSHAVSLFLSSAVDSRHDRRVSDRFSEMCREVVIGQYLEMTAPYRRQLDRDDLMTILRLKSGRYSVERPLQLGALLAGAPEHLVEALARYGLALGEAFQLQDDLLGVFGDLEEVGKPVGGDLAEGKFTVLIQSALERADEDGKQAIYACLEREDPTTDEIAEVRDIVERVGARQHVESMVEERLTRSSKELRSLQLSGEGQVFLSGLIGYLRERRF